MSDPFDRLRGSSSDPTPPTVDAIRSRARRIQRRRYTAIASSSVVLVMLAGIGLFIRTRPDVHRTTTTTNALAGSISTAAPTLAEKAAAPTNSSAASGAFAGAGETRLQPQSADATAAKPANGLVLSVDVAKHAPGEDFTLKACNEQATSFTEQMRGTTYDFEVSRGSTVVWRWSFGKMQPQYVAAQTWKPHECKTWSATWDGHDQSGKPLAPGTYDVVGILKAYPNDQRTAPRSFCLDVC